MTLMANSPKLTRDEQKERVLLFFERNDIDNEDIERVCREIADDTLDEIRAKIDLDAIDDNEDEDFDIDDDDIEDDEEEPEDIKPQKRKKKKRKTKTKKFKIKTPKAESLEEIDNVDEYESDPESDD